MEIVPSEDFDRALGTTEFFTGFLMLTCPLQGKLYDITGEYRLTFVISGSLGTLGGGILLSIIVTMLRSSSK